MAIEVLTDAYVVINGVDLSDHVKQVKINYGSELQDDTLMGDTTRSRIGGLYDWSIELQFAQDFASGSVDATLWNLVGKTFTVGVRKSTAARSTTNPEYSGTGILESYPPIDGSVGDLHLTSVTIQSAGALSRLTA